ncbi:MAG: pyruvate formate lyase-activating protein [Flavobacteriales bacterium]|nr:pyruvate formate lyase-activating protein [Flavobacteriales bacterium]
MELKSADPTIPLEGSPYDLRVSLGEQVPEFDRKAALESGDWGFIHSFTTGSAVDGPGMRVVAWLTSCQFRCAFCHNPDTWKLSNGMPVPLQRAVDVVKQYRIGLKTMHGGLTISGGEPLMQKPFLIKLFQGAKAAGIHTALDTNGALGDRLTDEDLKSIDLVMLGLKAVTPDLHKRLTGMDNAPSLAFARRLAALKHPAWIRFVVVPGFTDTLDEIGKMADLAAELGNIERVDLLPFHQLGKFKWEKLGMDYPLKDAVPPSQELMEQAAERFRSVGVNVV